MTKAQGKKYKGEQFSTTRTPEAATKAAKKFATAENKVSLAVYFTLRGVRNPVQQDAMRAYTDTRSAPVDAFDKIFKDF